MIVLGLLLQLSLSLCLAVTGPLTLSDAPLSVAISKSWASLITYPGLCTHRFCRLRYLLSVRTAIVDCARGIENLFDGCVLRGIKPATLAFQVARTQIRLLIVDYRCTTGTKNVRSCHLLSSALAAQHIC